MGTAKLAQMQIARKYVEHRTSLMEQSRPLPHALEGSKLGDRNARSHDPWENRTTESTEKEVYNVVEVAVETEHTTLKLR